jgi:hypothetical protein
MRDRFASEQMIGLTSECVIDMPRNIQLLEKLNPQKFLRGNTAMHGAALPLGATRKSHSVIPTQG